VPFFTVDEKVNIYYGGTKFIEGIDKRLHFPPGIFYCSKAFCMSNYIEKWGKHVLSSQAKVTTLYEFSEEQHPLDSLWFVRPNADDKSFAGGVMDFGQLQEWTGGVDRVCRAEAEHGNVPDLTGHTPILVGPAYHIKKEWRNFVVNGRVVASTLYRKDHTLNKVREAPSDMLDFVHARCAEYVPSKAFVMDIALCGDEFYIIECGCINSAGFYAADVDVIVEELSKAMAS